MEPVVGDELGVVVGEEDVGKAPPASVPLPCDECARRFSSKKAMYRHKSEAHPKDKTKLMCPVCLVKVPALPPSKQFSATVNALFSSVSSVRRHVKKVHNDWEQALPTVEMTSLVESCLEITAAFQEGITFSDRMSIFKRWVNRMEFRPTFIDGDSHDISEPPSKRPRLGDLEKKKVENEIEKGSIYTQKLNKDAADDMTFADDTDLGNATRGFLATVESPGQIRNELGEIAIDLGKLKFLNGEPPDTVHPTLWRQSKLNSIHGLFEVIESAIYQVRGFDFANMTFLRTDQGWIVVDPLSCNATARVALELFRKHGPPNLRELPIKAIIITNSQMDHFGGIRGVIEAPNVAKDIQIIAPYKFTENALSHSALAGTAMGRRSTYMYGALLPWSPYGSVGTGLGHTIARGPSGFIPPTHEVKENGQRSMIDGLEIEFLLCPGGESSEFMFYLPQLKAFCQSEVINHTLHNLYSLSGAPVRSGLRWSKYVDEALIHFGNDIELSFGCHHWPTWGNAGVRDLFEKQRDVYRFIHDQTLRLANHGYTMNEIAEMMVLPRPLSHCFHNRGSFGSLCQNVKAQYQLYFGLFDGNPSNLNPLPPREESIRYMEYMGGTENVLKRAVMSYEKGDFRWVASVLKHVVFADPSNRTARHLLARTFTQLGFQSESGVWRNFYLSGAQEILGGVRQTVVPQTLNRDMIVGMSMSSFFDLFAVCVNGVKAGTLPNSIFHVKLTDKIGHVVLILSNGVLIPRINAPGSGHCSAIINAPRDLFEKIILREITFRQAMAEGKASVEGDLGLWCKLLDAVESFSFWFHVVEP